MLFFCFYFLSFYFLFKFFSIFVLFFAFLLFVLFFIFSFFLNFRTCLLFKTGPHHRYPRHCCSPSLPMMLAYFPLASG